MTLREGLLRLMRVPHRPIAPAGDRDVRVFRAAPGYFRYRLLRWALTNAGALIGLLWSIAMMRGAGWRTGAGSVDISIPADLLPGSIGPLPLAPMFMAFEIVGVIGVATHAIASLALLRLDFEQRWYIVSDRSLRIRAGIVRMHEKTMTFANIQQVTIKQGPVQRLLRIADLQVRTAGGGGGESDENKPAKDDLHVAYFRGVADAEHIRDTIRERLRHHGDAGLGDPDDAPDLRGDARSARITPANLEPLDGLSAARPSVPPPLLDAARELAEEAALLRVRLTRSPS